MKRVLLFAVLILLTTGYAQAQINGNPTLEDLLKADLVFTGTCISSLPVKVQPPGQNSQISAIKYTFEISEVLKGSVASNTFSFSQFNSPELPRYKDGDGYTLFLTNETRWGLRAPVAFGAGAFRVVTGPNGEKQLVNDRNNKDLFNSASPAMVKAKGTSKLFKGKGSGVGAVKIEGPVDYDAFSQMVKSLEQQKKK